MKWLRKKTPNESETLTGGKAYPIVRFSVHGTPVIVDDYGEELTLFPTLVEIMGGKSDIWELVETNQEEGERHESDIDS